MMEGEIPVDVIDQLRSSQMEQEMSPQLNFYPEPENGGSCSPPERQHPVFYDLTGMVHASTVDLSNGAPIPPYPIHPKQKRESFLIIACT